MKFNLTQAFKDILTDYSDDVAEKVTEILSDVGRDAAHDLHTAGDFKDRTGKYRKGWTVTTEQKRTYAGIVVHNTKHYRIAHLLEYGHAVDNGRGNKDSSTKSYPHIAPINDKAVERAIERVKEEIPKL